MRDEIFPSTGALFARKTVHTRAPVMYARGLVEVEEEKDWGRERREGNRGS